MVEDIKTLENGILEKLPQIPFVVDQVGYAMNWAREAYDEGAYYKNVKLTLDVANYVEKISQPNFFKTHLIIAALLMDIPNVKNDAKFEMFKTASNAVENALSGILVDPELNEKQGCFKSVSMKVVELAKTNQEYLAVILYSILSDLNEIVLGIKKADIKSPVTIEDYVKVLGYAFVMQGLRMSKVPLLDSTREVINKIEIILNNDLNF